MVDWLYPLLRFGHYALLLAMFGITAFQMVGLRQAMLGYSERSPGLAIIIAAIAAPIVSAGLMLVSISAMMAQPLWQLEWATVEAIVTNTSVGWAFIMRLALLTAAIVTLNLLRPPAKAYSTCAILFGFALVTLPWSGHAAASEGTLGLVHRMNDALHLLAAGLWIGAIGWFLYLTVKAHRQPNSIARAQLLSDLHSFAPLGVLLVIIVGGTGLINAQLVFGLENTSVVLLTEYGWLLAAKVGLVGTMLFFGIRNAFVGRRYAKSGKLLPNTQDATLATLRISLAAEFALGIIVIGLTAIIGMMAPMGG